MSSMLSEYVDQAAELERKQRECDRLEEMVTIQNRTIKALSDQVAEMQPLVEAVGKLEEWRGDDVHRNWTVSCYGLLGYACALYAGIAELAYREADTLPAAIEAAMKQVGVDDNTE